MLHSSFSAESTGRFQAIVYEESGGRVVWSCLHDGHHTELSALNCAGREWRHRAAASPKTSRSSSELCRLSVC